MFGDLLAQARQSKKSLVICWRKPDNRKNVWRASGTSQTIEKKFGEHPAQARFCSLCETVHETVSKDLN
ncbi:hypothetical protein [Labilibaculum euxinus]